MTPNKHSYCNIRIETADTNEGFGLQVEPTQFVHEIHEMIKDKEETCHRTCFSLQLGDQLLQPFRQLKDINGIKDGCLITLVDCEYTRQEARRHVSHIVNMVNSSGHFSQTVSLKSVLSVNAFRPPPGYILPGVQTVPSLLALLSEDPNNIDQAKAKIPTCLKRLVIRELKNSTMKEGELMVLDLVTAEDNKIHVAVSTKGFYVSNGEETFSNPKQENSHPFHSLVDLLGALSPSFKQSFEIIRKTRSQLHRLERQPASFEVNSWLLPRRQLESQSGRVDSMLVIEDDPPRDWIGEISKIKMNVESLDLDCEYIKKEYYSNECYKSLIELHIDFVREATRGAVGFIQSDCKENILTTENIIFSRVSDPEGFASWNHELHGLGLLNAIGCEYKVETVIVDYKGLRVAAQSIIPGTRDKKTRIVYGLDEYSTWKAEPKFIEEFDHLAIFLHLLPHKISFGGQVITTYTPLEFKGVEGADGKFYLTDLRRMYPPDLNFLPERNIMLSEKAQELGFPRKTRDQLCSLRKELRMATIYSRYLKTNPIYKQRKNMTERFNANVFRLPAVFVKELNQQIVEVKLADEACAIEYDENQIKIACNHLATVHIPALLCYMIMHRTGITDGADLTAYLHETGLNMRYLGDFLKEIVRADLKPLSFIYTIGINELVSRCAKRIFRSYIQAVSANDSLHAAIAHFLNCYFGNVSSEASSSVGFSSVGFRMTSILLWKQLTEEAISHYNFEVTGFDHQAFSKHQLGKLVLLRSLCKKTGLQIRLREYNFETANNMPIFNEQDVQGMLPVVKHVGRLFVSNLFKSSVRAVFIDIEDGRLSDASERINKEHPKLLQVLGPLHKLAGESLNLQARLAFLSGDHEKAHRLQSEAVLTFERVLGIDHARLVSAYQYFAVFTLAATGQLGATLELLYRARYLLLVVFGSDDHPEISFIDASLGVVLAVAGQLKCALKFLAKSRECNDKYFSNSDANSALVSHLLKRLQPPAEPTLSLLDDEKLRENLDIFVRHIETMRNCNGDVRMSAEITKAVIVLLDAINLIQPSVDRKPRVYPRGAWGFPTMVSKKDWKLKAFDLTYPISDPDIRAQ